MKNKIKMIENPDQWELNKYTIKTSSRGKWWYQLLKICSLGPQQGGGQGDGINLELSH